MENLLKEVNVRTARSSGSGGQHVNKVETKVELIFDIQNSVILVDHQKIKLLKKLNHRLTKDGLLIVSSQKSRSQKLNRKDALKKLEKLITKALQPEKRRKPVLKLVAHKEKRLKQKKAQALKKRARQKVIVSDSL